MDGFIKGGDWWELSICGKVLRWLHYLPFAYLYASVFAIPAWRANRNDVSLGVAFHLLVSLRGDSKLNRWWQLEEIKE